MKTIIAAFLLATTATAGLAQSTVPPAAPAAAPQVTFIHAGQLLADPAARPRGNTTIIVRDGRIAELRDGFAAPESL